MAGNEKRQLRALIADVPVGENKASEGALKDGKLDFENHANVLAEATMYTPDTITIGVYGEWGTGKTSLMRMMHAIVDANPDTVAVWFNAWQYEREEHLIVPLTATIVKAIETKMEKQKKRWEKGKGAMLGGAEKALKALRGIIYGIELKGKVGVPEVAGVELGLSPEKMINRYQELTKEVLVERTLYHEAFEHLRELVGESVPKIVVFVDDLDRCAPDKAIDVLESIKLVLCQPGFSFVLGMDHKIIQAFLKKKYRECLAEDQQQYYEDYLDKLVQVRVDIPHPEGEPVLHYIQGLLADEEVFGPEAEDHFKDLIPVIGDACENNPRSIVRFLNDLVVRERIGKLKKETYDIGSLAIACALTKERYAPLSSAFNTRASVALLPSDEAKQRTAFQRFHLFWEDSRPAGEERSYTLGEAILTLVSADIRTQAPADFQHALRDLADMQDEPQAKAALTVLAENPHLWKLFDSESGRKWLENPQLTLAAAPKPEPGSRQPEAKKDWSKIIEAVQKGKNPLDFTQVVEDIQRWGHQLPHEIREHIKDLTPLAELEGVMTLHLNGCTGLADLGPLGALANLQELDLSRCTGLADLGPLGLLAKLKWLVLSGCTGLENLGPLSTLTELEGLNLSGCTGLEDLRLLGTLTELKSLSLSGWTGLADLGPLGTLANLQVLDLSGCTGLADLGPLATLANLKELDLSGCTGIAQIPEALRNRKDLHISSP